MYEEWLKCHSHTSYDLATECFRWAGESAELGRVRCVKGVLVLARLLEHLEAFT